MESKSKQYSDLQLSRKDVKVNSWFLLQQSAEKIVSGKVRFNMSTDCQERNEREKVSP